MAAKKKATRKRASRRPRVKAGVVLPQLELQMPLDARKVAAIQRCLKKGTLKLKISRVDLTTGRAGDGWLYD